MELVYKSIDGLFFSTKEQCEDHEKSVKTSNKIAAIQKLFDESSYRQLAYLVHDEYHAIKAIMEDNVASVEVDWTKVPKGTIIFVRNHEGDDDKWVERELISYEPCLEYSFSCKNPITDERFFWHYAKLK